MDVFSLRERVVADYRDYVESFINILDERIEEFVRERLASGELWPDAVLQLNPAYEPAETLDDLARLGVIRPETARFFGPSLRLYRHQRDALEAAQRGDHYVVSTGTGSGKSLTYLIPIVDNVFGNQPERRSVRAVIVYPMNALINSQLDALKEFRRRNWSDCPIDVRRYTGQETNEERDAILRNPPHVLLTNYVMLEYLLIRPYERSLLQQTTRELRFLVLDELHVYRGRQGADVAMLLRRVRQRAGRADLQLVGTSATLVTQGRRDERRARIAEVASTLFGVEVRPASVIDETLQRVVQVPAPADGDALRAAVLQDPPRPSRESVVTHPLAAWVEETFGLEVEDGRLVRRQPLAFASGLRRLVEQTGLDEELCRARLEATLDAGNRTLGPNGEPLFAFRLHQFLSSGSSVYATLQASAERLLTMEGTYVAPAGDQQQRRLLYPLAFCRECGQEYYLVSRVEEGEATRLLPGVPLLNASGDDVEGTPGYFAVERDDLWSDNEDLPESWQEQRAAGPRVKASYARYVPVRYWVQPDGQLSREPIDGAVEGWFQPRPFMLCLRCRAVYDPRERSDFAKLATLSQTGRSTATTLVTSAAVIDLRESGVDRESCKVLSFTDSRQDASLQAGHLNDFVQVALLRGALLRAVEREGSLTFDRIGAAVFSALNLEPEQLMRSGEAVSSGPGYEAARQLMVELLQYRAFEDLRRAWRVAQPNLEQCGLLRIDYAGLAELASDDQLWAGAPVLSILPAPRREQILRAVLDHLRGLLAIDARALTRDWQESFTERSRLRLSERWAIDEYETLRRSTIALLPGVTPARGDERRTIGLGPRSAIGRYLRSRYTYGALVPDLSPVQVEELVWAIVRVLQGQIFTMITRDGDEYGIQIKADTLIWTRGDGKAPGPDPVRARSLYLRRAEWQRDDPNPYFARLYQERALALVGVAGREHTGMVDAADRIERENAFREGKLTTLFCSPTMELGIDIRDLSVVHLRNVPPTPANYAQRGGRAGRGGRPALVLAFCSQGNAHDQYFFRNRREMIAGAVAPARMDLQNRGLVEAHLHSIWLSFVGLDLGRSMDELLDVGTEGYPLRPDKAAQLEISPRRQREIVEAFREVRRADDPSFDGAPWFTNERLEQLVADAPRDFDAAFNRWRELYRTAVQQRDAARRIVDRPRLSRDERRIAERQEQEAKREIDLLFNRGDVTESDFYPYRYLATEGFLPGYNFPRLPLRALVTVGERSQAIDRPRFLGLSEFGPQNVIYHEGRKFRVNRCVLPAGGLSERLTRARICRRCGYIHPREAASADVCEFCGATLDGTTSDFPQALLDQPTVRATRWARITSDEEERAREGYEITTHFRFAPDDAPRVVEARAPEGAKLLTATYAPQTDVWRINHGWRRSADRNGFTIDQESGLWRKREDDPSEDSGDSTLRAPMNSVKPFVLDQRNVLLLRPAAASDDDAFFATLGYALQRAIQYVYQVEEQEIEIEIIGQGDQKRILLWEGAEGGTGIWDRLIGDSGAFREIAREGLRICHFDPDTGEADPVWDARCTAACYECLLSFRNQPVQRYLDRRLIREYLLALTGAELVPASDGRSYDEQYTWLRGLTDPASSLEREFLDYLYQRRLRLPDRAQSRPTPDVNVQPDFYYERRGVSSGGALPGVCIFVDGPARDQPDEAARARAVREDLADRGFRVLSIRYDRSIADQIAAYPEIFGPTAG